MKMRNAKCVLYKGILLYLGMADFVQFCKN